jgi:hypothetical protein
MGVYAVLTLSRPDALHGALAEARAPRSSCLRRQVTSVHVSPCDRYRIFAITCPFALLNHAGRRRVLDAYRDDPQAGAVGLVMEHLAVSLNPRQGLIAGQRLAHLLAQTPGHQHTLAAFQSALDRMPWRLYEIRRAVLPGATGPGKIGRAARWLRTHGTGTRTQMTAALSAIAASKELPVTAEDGIPRAWARRRGQYLPAADWFFVAAPEGAEDKEGPGFAVDWPTALAGPAQQELFTEPVT